MSEYAQDDFDFDADPLAAADFDDAFDTSDFEPPPLPTCGCGHPWYTHGLYGCGAGAGSALLCPCAATGPAPPGRPQDEPVAPATTAEPLQTPQADEGTRTPDIFITREGAMPDPVPSGHTESPGATTQEAGDDLDEPPARPQDAPTAGESTEQTLTRMLAECRGLTPEQVQTTRFRMSPTTCRKHRRAAGLDPETGKAPHPEPQPDRDARAERALELRAKGMPLSSIAQILGCDKATVHRDLKARQAA